MRGAPSHVLARSLLTFRPFTNHHEDRTMTNRLLKVPEVMDRLQVSRSTLHEMVKRGDLPVVKLGRCVRVPEVEVQRLMDTSTTTAAA